MPQTNHIIEAVLQFTPGGTTSRNGSVRRSSVVDGRGGRRNPAQKEQVSQRQKEPEEQRGIDAHERDNDAHHRESRPGIDGPPRNLHPGSIPLTRPPFFLREQVLPQDDQRQGSQPNIRGKDDRGNTVSLLMADQGGHVRHQRDEEQMGKIEQQSPFVTHGH